MAKPLDAYKAKRDFSKTPEPPGAPAAAGAGNAYVIQKHAARRLHYDFRLELQGVLKSWAVPEGPSLVAGKKRLAVHVEDHPLEYGGFEGVIPAGGYGAGTVMIWDRGTWTPEFDPDFGYKKGHLKFQLDGAKLKGQWHLVRMAPKPREKQEAWLLFKSDDAAARPADAPDILADMPLSAATGRSLEAIARDHDRTWTAGQGETTPEKESSPPATPAVDAARIPRAKAAPLPGFIEPILPSPTERAPAGGQWLHEIKYDGYRIQARIENGRVTLLTRQGLDWTERFATVAAGFSGLPVTSAIVDGEVVMLTESGVASFTALVDALKNGSGNMVHYAFDLLHLDGHDLRDSPLVERKKALAALLAGSTGTIRYSDHIEGDGDAVFRHASRLGLEGIVSKQRAAPYRSGRVKTWLKVKATQSGPFVIAGFIPSTVDKEAAVGALVLAEYAGTELVASGHVGSGFTQASARQLRKALEPLRRGTAPLKDDTAVAKGVKWVEPELTAEIEYRTRTGAGLIRHAVFRELLQSQEKPQKADAPLARSVPAGHPLEASEARVRLTNPGRLLWPAQGITKQGLADFYGEIADWLLPHIVGRPLSLVRCPEGVAAQCFYKKHRWAGLGDNVRSVPVPGDTEPMLAIDDLAGLMELVQASILEIHPWGATAERPEQPDRVTIDLDPGDDVPWPVVVEAAREVRQRLTDHRLQSFVKTTGGKGLHVVFPLAPDAGWDEIKAFAQSIATAMGADQPQRYTANMAKSGRRGRIFVDYLRNGLGATAVAAYSTRARDGAPVSVPIAWDELGPAIRADHFTVLNLPNRLAFLDRDPWAGFAELRQLLPTSARKSPRIPVPDVAAPTKAQLAAYWKKMGKDALVHLARRPLELVRPVEDGPLAKTIQHVDVGDGTRPWVDSVEGLLGLTEAGAVELHPWGATVDDLERPDTLVFRLGAGPGEDWKQLVERAFALRAVLQAEELDSWPKLTGEQALDVMVPVEPDLDWREAEAYSRQITAALGASVDCSFNARGQAAVGAWSPRARPGFPVATPLDWKTLERGMRPEAYTLRQPRGRKA